MAGHVVGKPLRGNISTRIVVDVDPHTNVNRLAIVYFVLGDTVVLQSMLVLATAAINPSIAD